MTNGCHIIMWGEGPRSGGREFFSYLLEACCQNAYVLKIYEQADRRIKDIFFLDFRLELAAQIIGTFSGRARVGRPRSQSPVDVRLDQTAATTYCSREAH